MIRNIQKSFSMVSVYEPERNCPAAFMPTTSAPSSGKNDVKFPNNNGAVLANRWDS